MRTNRTETVALRFCTLAVLVFGVMESTFAQSKTTMRERVDTRRVIRSTHEMTATGTFFLDPPADAKTKADRLKPESLKVSARTKSAVQDRWRLRDSPGLSTTGALTSLRVVESAETEIGGEIRPARNRLRPNRRRMLVEIDEEMARIASLDGPLTRSELEALTTPADAATLWALLPKEELMTGASYDLDRIAAKSLSLYDSIAVNGLKGKVEEITETSVRISISGELRGAVLGAEGLMKIRGELNFDRVNGFVDRLDLDRDENRRPGSVEAGLDIRSELKVRRSVVATPAQELTGEGAEWPKSTTPEMMRLEWFDPTGTIRLEHERDWHATWSDTEESVLKRVDRGGTVVAQCNVKKAPTVAPGRHQDPGQFREDVREALGDQFRRVFGEGTLDRPAGQGYGYKMAVEGVVQDLPVVWYYYLLASPQGQQYVATVTTTLAETEGSGKAGLMLAETLRWSDRTEKRENTSP